MDQKISFNCLYADHEGEEIIGFCLDMNCQRQPKQICQKCWDNSEIHKNCRPNCLTFSQISLTLKQSIKIIEIWEMQQNQSLYKFKQKHQFLLQTLSSTVKKFQQIKENISQSNYSTTKQYLNLIKEFHHFIIQNQLITSSQTIYNIQSQQLENLQDQKSCLNMNFYDSLCFKPYTQQLNEGIFFDIGISLLQQENSQQANQELTKLSKSLEKNLSFLKLCQSIALVEINKPGEGRMVKDQAITLNPHLSQDILYLTQKQLNINPMNKNALISKSYALEMDDQFEHAIQVCDQVLALDQNHLHALCRKGGIYYQDQRFNTQIVKQKEQEQQKKQQKQEKLEIQEIYKEQEECLNQVLKLNPNFIQAIYYKGNLLQKQNKFDEAIKLYLNCTELDPKFSLAFCNIGCSLINQGHYIKAQKFFLEAIKIDKDCSLAYQNYGYSLNQSNQSEQAIFYYSQALRINPRQKDIYKQLGYILTKLKRYDQAQAIYNDAIQNFQQDQNEFENLKKQLLQSR